MNLKCPTCDRVIQRAESHKDCAPKKLVFKKVRILQVERSLSMNMADRRSPDGQEGRGDREAMAKMKRSEHRRIQSAGAYPGDEEPRLLRSSGMRRDWSFEKLTDKNEERVMCR